MQISTVTTDMEHSVIKEYLESISKNKPSNQFIYVKEDMSHIFKINDAIGDNKIVCFTGDRYFEGVRSLKGTLLGAEATFPAGPFFYSFPLESACAFCLCDEGK